MYNVHTSGICARVELWKSWGVKPETQPQSTKKNPSNFYLSFSFCGVCVCLCVCWCWCRTIGGGKRAKIADMYVCIHFSHWAMINFDSIYFRLLFCGLKNYYVWENFGVESATTIGIHYQNPYDDFVTSFIFLDCLCARCVTFVFAKAFATLCSIQNVRT